MPSTRSAPATRPRRSGCGFPRGKRTRLYLDRAKASRTFLGAPGLTTRKMENTFAALTAYITNRTFDYDFEHLPATPSHTDIAQFQP